MPARPRSESRLRTRPSSLRSRSRPRRSRSTRRSSTPAQPTRSPRTPRRPTPRRRIPPRRTGLLFALFLLLLSVAALRALWLGTVRSGSLSERAVSQQIEDIEDPARRGTIYDRNGVELAVSEDSATVFAHPFLIDDPGKAAAQLAPLVGRTEDELLRKLSSKESFVYLRRKMDATLGEAIEKLEIEGIGMVTEPKRVYPQGFLAAQVLGVVGTDNVGLAGLEYAQDEELRGEDGERSLIKDALGE